ncbi:anti-sigma-D factor RsdA [Micromonospora coerulea]|uniref:anti-sigma-D factor RsdA n=1 Tax=Micromonospora coerulea TaxID=47856 RepID=UPI0019036562|nr:anti-sigma-D factor RsdA [Micromonospora veneta]
MTPEAPPPADDPVRRDDELLDAIRRGAPPPADDPVAALLAGWHNEVETHAARLDAAGSPARTGPDGQWTVRHAVPAVTGPTAARPRHDAAGAKARHEPNPDGPDAGTTGGGPDPADGASPGPATARPGRPARRERSRADRPPRRHPRVLAGAAVALLTVTGGIWLGSARAEPDGLLWPVTEVVWTERAELLRTEREIGRMLEQARRDLTAGRYAEARTHLERAAALLAGLDDDAQLSRLRVDLDDLRRRLPTAGVPTPAPGGPPSASMVPPGAESIPPPTAPAAGDDIAETSPATLPSVVAPPAERTQRARPARPERPPRPAPARSGATPGATLRPPRSAPATPGATPGATMPAAGRAAPGRELRAQPRRPSPTTSGGAAATAAMDRKRSPSATMPPTRSAVPSQPAAGRTAAPSDRPPSRPVTGTGGADSLPR